MTGVVGPVPTRAVIIAVGSELLTAYKTDTNSLRLTDRLNDVGIELAYKVIVGDDRDAIAAALRDAVSRADLVVVTGGLGPTEDDVTREVTAAVLNLPLAEAPDLVDAIRTRFTARGLTMPEVNRRQAAVPRGATIVPNPFGTAPGLWMVTGGVIVVLLPGPPRELRPMFDRLVDERIAPLCGGRRVYRRVIRTTGRSESQLDELAKPIYLPWRERQPPIETTILASRGQIDLHLSVRGAAAATATGQLDDAALELAGVLGSSVVSTDGRSLEAVVGVLLRERRARIAVAESCTGGLIASRLTDVPGSSDYLSVAWVVYGNDAKVAELGVDPAVIARDGAVSEAVAAAMARGARRVGGVEVGLGVTGIAGPGGGTPDKPVGTVWLAVAGPDETALAVRCLQLPGERDLVKELAAQMALDLVRRILLRAAGPGVS